MLEFLRGRASDRKLRLFAVACCRRFWNLIRGEHNREAVEVAERFAGGTASKEELRAARRRASDPTAKSICYSGGFYAAWRASVLVPSSAAQIAMPESAGVSESHRAWSDARQRELNGLCGPLRDVVGPLPFRPSTLAPALLTWNDATVVRLAQAAYTERRMPEGTLDNARLAVLADALEEAGCADSDLLGHLRGSGPHVRGCWSVDLLLGKG